MGQGASANAGFSDGEGDIGSGSGATVKTCYYELLAVPRDATQDEYVCEPKSPPRHITPLSKLFSLRKPTS